MFDDKLKQRLLKPEFSSLKGKTIGSMAPVCPCSWVDIKAKGLL